MNLTRLDYSGPLTAFITAGLVLVGCTSLQLNLTPLPLLRSQLETDFRSLEPRNAYRARFESASDAELRSLKAASDDSSAIQAAWEELRRAANAKPSYDTRTAKLAQSFLAAIEKRSEQSAPDWWREANHSRFGGEASPSLNGQSHFHRYSDDEILCPQGAFVEKRDGLYVYREGSDFLEIPQQIFSPDKRGWKSDVSACFTSERCFLTVYSSWCDPHELYCIERDTNKVTWTSKVCGCDFAMVYASGLSIGEATVTVTGKQVIVHGSSGGD